MTGNDSCGLHHYIAVGAEVVEVEYTDPFGLPPEATPVSRWVRDEQTPADLELLPAEEKS